MLHAVGSQLIFLRTCTKYCQYEMAAPQTGMLGLGVQALGLSAGISVGVMMSKAVAVLLELFALSSDTSSQVCGLFI